MDERQLFPFIPAVSSLCLLNVGLISLCSPPAVAKEWNRGVTLLELDLCHMVKLYALKQLDHPCNQLG